MTLFTQLLMLCCASWVLCSPAGAFSKRPQDTWVYYHFDGSSFQAGSAADGSPLIAVRDRFQPVITSSLLLDNPSQSLSPKSGVIAGICYFRRSGGKFADNPGYTPCSGVQLSISSGGRQHLTVKTDHNGYFIAVLNAGSYTVTSGAFMTNVDVENGKTMLVPLLAGKRMVD